MNVRKKYIRAVVERLLEETGQHNPPIDPQAIARRLNASVREAAHDDQMSGFLYKDPASGETIIGINKSHSPARRRFTTAHELGHLILHAFDSIHVDKAGYGSGFGQLKLRDGRSSAGIDPEEIEANFFAAELLMPAAMLEKDLEACPYLDLLDERAFGPMLQELAKRYKVSPQALSIRLVQLGLLHVT
jgi:Zn-dependent peptidase ImmA (M78 family)